MVVLQSARYGRVTIDGIEYTQDLYVFPDGQVAPRPAMSAFGAGEASLLLGTRPEVVVIGRGFSSRLHVTDEARVVLAQHGVEVVEKRTHDVLRIVNDRRLRQRVAAVLHLAD